MSKRFKAQASSARAASATFGLSSSFGPSLISSLSYIAESPDLSSISDPNVVVALRNLGKKDSTTKTKALEELQELFDNSSIEDTSLEAWISLYPRTSIDNSRRVRQLAHNLQGLLTSSIGKRIAPFLPKVIGSWLAGIYDNDKIVAKAAQDALSRAFSTEEKRQSLWKLYRDVLLAYAEDASLIQTSKTLSDERNTNSDDAEAKFVRVAGGGIYVLGQIIKLNSRSTTKATYTQPDDELVSLLKRKPLWDYAFYKDPYLRRAIYDIAVLCVNDYGESLDWSVMSTCFVVKGLSTIQLGSCRQYLDALIAFTTLEPGLWTSWYFSKTTAATRLERFLRQGSQRGPEDVWSKIDSLIRKIPISIWTSGDKDEVEGFRLLLDALGVGVRNPDEPRYNLHVAWSCYMRISFWVMNHLATHAAKEIIFTNYVLPLVIQYLMNDAQMHIWSLPSTVALQVVTNTISRLLEIGSGEFFLQTWSSLTDRIMNAMGLSLPSGSADYSKSQEGLIGQSSRYHQLKTSVIGKIPEPKTENQRPVSFMTDCEKKVLDTAIAILHSRNGKPYGAAAVLRDIVLQPSFDIDNSVLPQFFRDHGAILLESPSAEYLIKIILRSHSLFRIAAPTLLRGVNSSEHSRRAVVVMVSEIENDDLESNEELQTMLINAIGEDKDDFGRKLLLAAMQNTALQRSSFQENISQKLYDRLSDKSTESTHYSTVLFLSELFDHSSTAMNTMSSEFVEQLQSKLLLLAGSKQASISEAADALLAKLQKSTIASDTSENVNLKIIEAQLSGIGTPIAILAMVDLGQNILQQAIKSQNSPPKNLLPSKEQWQNAIQPHLLHARPASLSICSPLQGVLYTLGSTNTQIPHIIRDVDDFSNVFRMVIFTTRLMTNAETLRAFDEDRVAALYEYFPIALQLINEKLAIESANNIWLDSSEEVVREATDILSEGYSLIQACLTGDNISPSTLSMSEMWLDKVQQIEGSNMQAYFLGIAFADIMSRIVDLNGSAMVSEKVNPYLKDINKSQNIIQSSSLLSPLRDRLVTTDQGRKLLNEIIAEATNVKDGGNNIQVLRPLILLNNLLNFNEEPLEDIPSQRLVFLMQSLVRLLASQDTLMIAEVLKLLCAVLPAISDIYGDHWDTVLQTITRVFDYGYGQGDNIPSLHSALRLHNRLRKMTTTVDANEDLLDTMNILQPQLDSSLVQCLQHFGQSDERVDQPRQITTELLSRSLATVELKDEINTYELMKSKDQAIQNATFGLLHRSITVKQEQTSIDMVLEKTTPQLPEDLLKIVQEQPNRRQDQAGSRFSEFRSYLLSWGLLFDHFPRASHKLRQTYSTQIKDHNVLPPLLDNICDAINITSGRPIDPSKFDIHQFELGVSESEEHELKWLTIHLYFKCLLYLPSLTKAWFIEQKNRIKTPLEFWTQKYISPLIMIESVSAVTTWETTQDQDESPITIKSSTKSTEIVASIAIDPESPPVAITISFPGSYPLDSPTVSSRTRVGVSEKNWQSWLRTIQIIIFSTGSVIEGLVAFRRNVQGALKGQSECAICYSIISTDMQRPDKRCGTCKNTFHGSCLFRWFKSSNSSSCPLCRNNFNYA